MKRSVWPDKDVQKELKKYNNSPHVLNTSSIKDLEWFTYYKVGAVPTVIVVDSKGKELRRSHYMDVKQMLRFLKKGRDHESI